MRNFTLKPLLLVFVLLFIESVKAEIKLPAIVSSNMVLQRNTEISLWGWADANEKIIIKTSWLEKPITIQANKEGDWRIEVKTTNSKETQTINLESESSNIKLSNILFGEVLIKYESFQLGYG